MESLLHQRYHGLEVVVVDNLSFDETESVLRDFGPRLTRVIREADNGQTHALLKGFGEGDAEILGWLNVDDMLMPDAVQRVVRAFSETGADVVSGHCSALDGRGQFQGYMASRVRPRPGLALHLADVIPQPACFFSRAAYEAVGGLDAGLHYSMDWDLWCRLDRARRRFVRLDDVLAGARRHQATKTARGGVARLRELARISSKHGPARLPVLAVLHLISNRASGSAVLQTLTRAARGLRGGDGSAGRALHGLGDRGRVLDASFRVRLPVFAEVRRVWLSVEGVAESSRINAWLASAPGVAVRRAGGRLRFIWRFEPPAFLPEIDVRCETRAAQRPSRASVHWR